MKKILITGGSGFIGGEFVRKVIFDKNIKIYFFYHKKKIYKKKYIYTYKVNLLDTRNLNSKIKVIKPDIIFHFAAHINPLLNEKKPKLAKDSFFMTKNIINSIKRYCPNTYFIFLSTDKIFGGNKLNPREFEDNKPRLKYGLFKLKSENLIRNKIKNYSIFRVPIVHGFGESQKCFIDTIIKKIKFKKNVKVFKNIKRSFISIQDLINILSILIFKKKLGTFNVGSKMMSYYSRVKYICKIKNIDFNNYLSFSLDGNAKPISQGVNSDSFKKKFNIKIK
jgi:dTDP-glucose 4,6-dehydratase